MRRSIQKKRILISGAADGVGQALARLAAEQGAQLVLSDTSARPLEELAGQLARKTEVVALATDLCCEQDRRRLLDTAVDQLGGLDVLINAGCSGQAGRFVDSTEERFRQLMEASFFAPAELIRQAIPVLTEGNQPAIVNLASLAGRRGLPGWCDVSTCEYALVGLTEALRGEMVRFGISMLLLITAQEPRPEANQVAHAVLNALQRNRRETVLGWKARWLLIQNRWLPGWVDRKMIRQAGQGQALAAR